MSDLCGASRIWPASSVTHLSELMPKVQVARSDIAKVHDHRRDVVKTRLTKKPSYAVHSRNNQRKQQGTFLQGGARSGEPISRRVHALLTRGEGIKLTAVALWRICTRLRCSSNVFALAGNGTGREDEQVDVGDRDGVAGKSVSESGCSAAMMVMAELRYGEPP
jgi:hypothetical protein